MGQFAGPSEQYGLPLSFIHPVDNDFLKGEIHPILLDPRWKLTKKQRREMQDEVDDVLGNLIAAREAAGGYDPTMRYPKESKENRNKRTQRRPQKRRK